MVEKQLLHPHGLRYTGKAKSVFETEDPERLILTFRDDVSAFNGVKTATIPGKGLCNCRINQLLVRYLEERRIPCHLEFVQHQKEAVVKRLHMIPIECVVRSVSAGSLCKRLGIPRGTHLDPVVFEFFLKDDALGDPWINASHAVTFGWADADTLEAMQRTSLAVYAFLHPLFQAADLVLVDYKLEFGWYGDTLMLGDELSPDGCRIWDLHTHQVLDKDIFREDLGPLLPAYEAVYTRLSAALEQGLAGS